MLFIFVSEATILPTSLVSLKAFCGGNLLHAYKIFKEAPFIVLYTYTIFTSTAKETQNWLKNVILAVYKCNDSIFFPIITAVMLMCLWAADTLSPHAEFTI